LLGKKGYVVVVVKRAISLDLLEKSQIKVLSLLNLLAGLLLSKQNLFICLPPSPNKMDFLFISNLKHAPFDGRNEVAELGI